MNKYQAITEARKLLGLPERATMDEIKSRYRALMQKWHPDRCGHAPECLKKAKRIVDAYNLILNYCNQYKFSFSEEEVKRHFTEEDWWLQHFGEGPC